MPRTFFASRPGSAGFEESTIRTEIVLFLSSPASSITRTPLVSWVLSAAAVISAVSVSSAAGLLHADNRNRPAMENANSIFFMFAHPLFQSTVSNFTETGTFIDSLSTGNTDFSPSLLPLSFPAVYFIICQEIRTQVTTIIS